MFAPDLGVYEDHVCGSAHGLLVPHWDAKLGKKGPPPPADDPAAPVAPVVDVAQLCPPGMTARHFGQLYTTEFVQRVLAAARVDREFTASVVKNMAAEVGGTLYYLILSAKTRKRRAVMQSRKVVDLAAAYGAWCRCVCPGGC